MGRGVRVALFCSLAAVVALDDAGGRIPAVGRSPETAVQEASDAPPVLRVDPQRSYLVAITTRAGVLGFLGHEHGVLAPEWDAQVRYDAANPASARVWVNVVVPELLIDTAEARRRARLAAGPPADKIGEIRARMLGVDQLDAASHSGIRFVSETVVPLDPPRLRVSGKLTLHGTTRPVETVMTVRRIEQFLLFHGELSIRQTDYGITPVSIGGIVKVGDEVRIRYAIWVFAEP